DSGEVRMVYWSEQLSVAAQEILVHTKPVTIRDKFRVFRVSWDEKMMTTIDLKKLPNGRNDQPPSLISKMIGDEWVHSDRFAVLAVPSVIVPLEKTFLLNPKHRDFGK